LINLIWLLMLIAGVVTTAVRTGGDVSGVTEAIVTGSADAVKLAIALVGILAFWSGIMQLAEDAGMTRALGRLLSPVVRRLFPSVPGDHQAMGSMLLTFSANLLGLGNAATPLGIKAMQELQELNPNQHEASDAMCTFVIICASGLTIVPGTVIALRAAAGSQDPTAIVGPTLIVTAFSTCGALIADRLLRHRKPRSPVLPPRNPTRRGG
jgi:spore maturation protein A